MQIPWLCWNNIPKKQWDVVSTNREVETSQCFIFQLFFSTTLLMFQHGVCRDIMSRIMFLGIEDLDIDSLILYKTSFADTYRKFREKKLAENPVWSCTKVIFWDFVFPASQLTFWSSLHQFLIQGHLMLWGYVLSKICEPEVHGLNCSRLPYQITVHFYWIYSPHRSLLVLLPEKVSARLFIWLLLTQTQIIFNLFLNDYCR